MNLYTSTFLVFGAMLVSANTDATAEDFPTLSSLLDDKTMSELLVKCADVVLDCLDPKKHPEVKIEFMDLFSGDLPPEDLLPLVLCSLEVAYGAPGDAGCVGALEQTEIGTLGRNCRSELEKCEDKTQDTVLYCTYQAGFLGPNWTVNHDCVRELSTIAQIPYEPPVEEAPAPAGPELNSTCGANSPDVLAGQDYLCRDDNDDMRAYNPAMDDEACNNENDDRSHPDQCAVKCCCRKKWVEGSCIDDKRRRPNNIKGCKANQLVGEKCEADRALPDGLKAPWNLNNCPGGFEIFEVVCR